jgi:hypothetical protein
VERRPEEIAQLQARAREALEQLDQLEPRAPVQHLRQLLRLWHDPAFGNPTAWAVFEHVRLPSDRQGHRLPTWMMVREATWDRAHDGERFTNPLQGVREGFSAPPTIRVRDGRIAQRSVTSWLREVRQLPIAILGLRGPVGLDGESWGIEVGDAFLQVRLQWWGAGPRQWVPVTQAIARLHTLLAGAVAQNNESRRGP